MINEYMLYLGDDWHECLYMDIWTHEVYGTFTRQEYYEKGYARKG